MIEAPGSPISPSVKLLNFPQAIKKLIAGKRIARQSWPKDSYGLIDENVMAIMINGEIHSWIVSTGDLQAKDWIVV